MNVACLSGEKAVLKKTLDTCGSIFVVFAVANDDHEDLKMKGSDGWMADGSGRLQRLGRELEGATTARSTTGRYLDRTGSTGAKDGLHSSIELTLLARVT